MVATPAENRATLAIDGDAESSLQDARPLLPPVNRAMGELELEEVELPGIPDPLTIPGIAMGGPGIPYPLTIGGEEEPAQAERISHLFEFTWTDGSETILEAVRVYADCEAKLDEVQGDDSASHDLGATIDPVKIRTLFFKADRYWHLLVGNVDLELRPGCPVIWWQGCGLPNPLKTVDPLYTGELQTSFSSITATTSSKVPPARDDDDPAGAIAELSAAPVHLEVYIGYDR